MKVSDIKNTLVASNSPDLGCESDLDEQYVASVDLKKKLNSHRPTLQSSNTRRYRDRFYDVALDQKQQLNRLVNNVPVALIQLTEKSVIISANSACKSIIGLPASYLLASKLTDHLTESSALELTQLLNRRHSQDTVLELSLEFSECVFDRPIVSARINVVVTPQSEVPDFYVCISHESRQQKITDQLRSAKDYLEKLATHDPLTGLPNRMFFVDTLRTAMTKARKSNRAIALFYFDLDGFKAINDHRGHHTGDLLLCEIANRLRIRIRDVGRLARLGGDEFTLILEHSADQASLILEAKRVAQIISEPVAISQGAITVTASIGIAVFPSFARTPSQLIRFADIAMYESKNKGGNCVTIYNEKHHAVLHRRTTLEQDFKSAISQSKFYLNFQPIVNAETMNIELVEVLARWEHPELGAISPTEFIPMAERTNHMEELTEWIFDATFSLCSALLERGIVMKFAVNVSPTQLGNPNLLETVINKMEALALPADMLELEITESDLINNISRARLITEEFHRYGCSLSVDDFGTGHSSLARLTELSVEKLKLDRLFVAELTDNEQSRIIVEGVILLAKKLGLEIVAEGVENADQVRLLKSFGCTYLQGFGVHTPCDTDSLVTMLSQELMSDGVERPKQCG